MRKLIVALCLACGVSTLSAADRKLKPGQTEATFKTDVFSDHCKKRVEGVIPFEKGVDDMDVQISNGTIKVVFQTSKNNADNIKKALEKLGYTVELLGTRMEKKKR